MCKTPIHSTSKICIPSLLDLHVTILLCLQQQPQLCSGQGLATQLHQQLSPCLAPRPWRSPSSSVQEWKAVTKSRFHSNGFTAWQLAFHSLTPDWKAPDKRQELWSYDPLPSIGSYLLYPASPEFMSTLLCFKFHLVTWLDLTKYNCYPFLTQHKDYVTV